MVTGVAAKLVFGLLLADEDVEKDDDEEEQDGPEIDEIVSTVLIVDERLGFGKLLNEEKSQDIAFFGVGRGESDIIEEGTEGSSLFTLLLTELYRLSVLQESLSLSSDDSDFALPTIHHRPDGLLCTLISSVFVGSISPAFQLRFQYDVLGENDGKLRTTHVPHRYLEPLPIP